MRAVVQRVTQAKVVVSGETVGEVAAGLVVLLGVEKDDTQQDAAYLARKIAQLRIFEDDAGNLNRSVLDIRGEILVVSQFTLLGDARNGNRPSYTQAEEAEHADALYMETVYALRSFGLSVATGRFRTHMLVELINDGPVTILLDSQKKF